MTRVEIGLNIMLLDWVELLGVWNWLVGGLLLIGLELLVPGVFIIWFGCGAVATALICALLGLFLPVFDLWQMQIVLFSLFSIAFVLLGRHLSQRRKQTQDNPFLNRRTDSLLGEVALLEEAIENGHGRIRIGDTLWRVRGADLAVGTSVRLVAFDEGAFLVEEVELRNDKSG